MTPRKKDFRSMADAQPSLFDEPDSLLDESADAFADLKPLPVIDTFVERVRAARAEADSRTTTPPADVEPAISADEVTINADDKIFYMSFGSGSSGNCTYIGDSHTGFLIDAGIDGERVERTLMANGIPMTQVKGILLTHDHGDHVRYAYNILRRHRHMRLYCTPKAFNGLLRRHNISRRIKDYHEPIYKEFEFKLGAFTITPFEVMHDGTDNAGFFIAHGNLRFALATDLGCISPRVDFYMRQAQFVMIESNYDAEMLRTGAYPEYLKSRIRAENGHLDNVVSAQFIDSIYTSELRYLFLCHLSFDNNTPQQARDAFTAALAHRNLRIGDGTSELTTDLQLIVLPRYEATTLYALTL
jgi:phosphoribosyl 1,2-cyclic phosphodiesterase